MAEGLKTPDGEELKLDVPDTSAFSRAMAAPPQADGLPEPPDRTEKAAVKAAPKTRTPRIAPDKAAASKPVKPGKAAPAPVKDDYTQEVQATVNGLWQVTAQIPLTQPFAYVLSVQADALVSALNEGAKHSESIRGMVAGTSEAAWWLPLTMVGFGMMMSTRAIYSDPEQKELARQATKKLVGQLAPAAPEAAPEEAPADGSELQS